MKPRPLHFSAAYREFASTVRSLHRLAVEGRDESPEADAIREASDLPWDALTEAERERATGLSGDLYSVSEVAHETEPMNPQAQLKINDFYESRRRGEWDRALKLLRRWYKYIDPPLLAYLRGVTWLEAGDRESAVLFFESARERDPDNPDYQVACLRVVDYEDINEFVESVLRSTADYSPFVVVEAVANAMKPYYSRDQGEAPHPQNLRRFSPILEEMIQRLEVHSDEGAESHRVLCSILLGLCHQRLGEHQAAVSAYSKGLAIDPQNGTLLTARGCVGYGSGGDAIRDLQLAISYGTLLIWPHYLLAHHHFVERRYQECLRNCEDALRIEGPIEAKCDLAEWLAISRAELGFPEAMVRSAFEDALRLDASNDRARRNLATFEAAMADPKSIKDARFETRSQREVQASALVERWPWVRAQWDSAA